MAGKMRRSGRSYGRNRDTTPDSGEYNEREVFNALGKPRKPRPLQKIAQYAFTGQAIPTLALPFNRNRRYLIIQNVSAATNLFLGFGAGATDTTGILILPAGGNYLADYACPPDEIYLFFTAGAAERAIICEGVLQPPI